MKRTFLILYGLSAFFYYLLIQEILSTLDVFYEPVFYVLMSLYLLFGYTLAVENKKWQFVCYFLWLVTMLFYRKSAVGFQFDFYLPKWLPYVFENKVITINVLGNILIFVPLGLYVKKIWVGESIIVAMEMMQVVTRRGMFDVVDIVLNTIGMVIGVIVIWAITKKTNELQKKNSQIQS